MNFWWSCTITLHFPLLQLNLKIKFHFITDTVTLYSPRIFCTNCRHAAVSRIPQKRKFCEMNQSDCRNHKFPGFHDFMLDAIRGISPWIKFNCRGIQDTLNIKEKFCPGFHDFSPFSCPGFHENSKIACLCTVMARFLNYASEMITASHMTLICSLLRDWS